MAAAFEESGNPFSEDIQDLAFLDSKAVTGEKAVSSLREVEQLGSLNIRSMYMYQFKIIPLFKKVSQTTHSRTAPEIRCLKNYCELFSRMYISCQSRDRDMD